MPPTQRLPSITTLQAAALSGAAGKDWYSTAREAFRDLCADRGLDYELFILIFAATSPRCSVWMNVRRALRVAEALKAGDSLEVATTDVGLMPSVRVSTLKVVRAYDDPDDQPLATLGPKTSAFAANLLGDESVVTLDTWMARLAGIPAADATRVTRRYVAIPYTKRIVKVARRLGWTPAQTQAALWLHAASTLGDKGHGEQDIQRAIDKAIDNL